MLFIRRGGSTVETVTILVGFVEDKVTVEQGFRPFSWGIPSVLTESQVPVKCNQTQLWIWC